MSDVFDQAFATQSDEAVKHAKGILKIYERNENMLRQLVGFLNYAQTVVYEHGPDGSKDAHYDAKAITKMREKFGSFMEDGTGMNGEPYPGIKTLLQKTKDFSEGVALFDAPDPETPDEDDNLD